MAGSASLGRSRRALVTSQSVAEVGHHDGHVAGGLRHLDRAGEVDRRRLHVVGPRHEQVDHRHHRADHGERAHHVQRGLPAARARGRGGRLGAASDGLLAHPLILAGRRRYPAAVTRMTPSTITVVGEALVDVVVARDGGVAEHPGGSPANVALALGRLGHDARLLTRLGQDERGRAVADHLAASHVVVEPASFGEGPTTTAVATIGAGRRGQLRVRPQLRAALARAGARSRQRRGAHRLVRRGARRERRHRARPGDPRPRDRDGLLRPQRASRRARHGRGRATA